MHGHNSSNESNMFDPPFCSEGWGGRGTSEDQGGEGEVEGRKGKKSKDAFSYLVFFLRPPKKPSPCFFKTTPKRKKSLFRQLIKKKRLKNLTGLKKIKTKNKIKPQQIHQQKIPPQLVLARA